MDFPTDQEINEETKPVVSNTYQESAQKIVEKVKMPIPYKYTIHKVNSGANKIAMVISIHPMHYKYMYALYNKREIITAAGIDLFLVFSNSDDHSCFLRDDFFNCIVFDLFIYQNVVFYKKMCALQILHNDFSYDDYIVIDSEIDIVDQNFTFQNVRDKINKIYDVKSIFALYNINNHIHNQITRYTLRFISIPKDKMYLYNYILNNRLYYWWYDLPVYKDSYLLDYFEKINFTGCYKPNQTVFDHKLYCNYLIFYRDFEITLVNFNIVSFEYFFFKDQHEFNQLIAKNYPFGWVNHKQFKMLPKFFLDQKTIIIYHLDRFQN
jgi:hypothetical protein